MPEQQKKADFVFYASEETAEEFAAAIEAATGVPQAVIWEQPMAGPDIFDALQRLLLGPRPDRGLDVLVRCGVLEAVLPEVFAMVGFGEGVRHKDVWSHTKKVVTRSPDRSVIRLAALFHDIGKVRTRKFGPDGGVTFIGHPEEGARMFNRLAGRLGFPAEARAAVQFLVASHLRASAYDDNWTDSAVRRFTRDVGDALTDLLDLSRADITSKYAEKVRRGTEQVNRLAERIEALREIDARPKPLPKGLGIAVIERFQIAPGPGLGRVIQRLKDEVQAGRLEVHGTFDHYLAFLEKDPTIIEEAAAPGAPTGRRGR
jgi:poly(A) polymerase